MKPLGSSGKRAGVNHDTDPAIKAARAVEKRAGERDAEEQLAGELHPAEERLIEHDAAARRDQCSECRNQAVWFYAPATALAIEPYCDAHVLKALATCELLIPGTFIMCGEGGNYCSKECLSKASQP